MMTRSELPRMLVRDVRLMRDHMIRSQRRVSVVGRTIGTGVLLTLGATGCSQEFSIGLADASIVSEATGVGRAASLAVSPEGAEAMVWVFAPDGGTDGRIRFTSAGGSVDITDPLGPVEAHDESPPKLSYGRDSASLYLLYVVARLEEGRRFPAAALRFVKSTDAGKSWSVPITITDDSEFGSHNFHALHVARDGSVYASWLDGRNGLSNVYVARSTDGGSTWTTNRRVFEGEACPCCRTAMATDSRGNLYVSWRGVLPGSIRDIVISRSSDHGESWTDPVRVSEDNWEFPGCPHAGPALQVDDEDRLHITWWTGVDGNAGVFYANSLDGTEWSEPYPIGVAEFSRPSAVQMSLSRDNGVLVAWADGTLEIPSIMMRASSDGGRTFSDRVEVSELGRHAFFPVLGLHGDEFTLLWSEQSHAHAEHEAESRPNMSDPSAVMGLSSVGQTQVIMRRGVMKTTADRKSLRER